jgi:hypothetical protein
VREGIQFRDAPSVQVLKNGESYGFEREAASSRAAEWIEWLGLQALRKGCSEKAASSNATFGAPEGRVLSRLRIAPLFSEHNTGLRGIKTRKGEKIWINSLDSQPSS